MSEAAQHLNRGRFASAVCSKKTKDGSGHRLSVKILNGMDVAKTLT